MAYRIVRCEQTGFDAEQIASFMRESYRERSEQGIMFNSCNETASAIAEEMLEKNFSVATDETSGALCGVISIHYGSKNSHGRQIKYAVLGNLAIAPSLKRSGLATLLFRSIEKDCNGCEYIESDTAVKAQSSVLWHLKMGFHIVGLRSFASTPYYSYFFKKQLVHPSKWDDPVYCHIRFILSSIATRFRHRADGKPTFINKLFSK